MTNYSKTSHLTDIAKSKSRKFSPFLLATLKLLFSPRQSRTYYSQFGEDCFAREFFGRGKNDGVYIDVGAYHPKKLSNTYHFYKKGWSGLVFDIEKSKILAHRILRPRDTQVLCAISDVPAGAQAVYANKEFSAMSSLTRDHSSNQVGVIDVDTLTSQIDKSSFKDRKIDFLSIDVEGIDLQVLLGLDFSRYSPRLICIESHIQSMENILRHDIHQLLSTHGYVICAWVGLSLFYTKQTLR